MPTITVEHTTTNTLTRALVTGTTGFSTATEIIIAHGYTSMTGEGVFYTGSGTNDVLEKVRLPSSMTSLGNGSFRHLSAIKYVIQDEQTASDTSGNITFDPFCFYNTTSMETMYFTRTIGNHGHSAYGPISSSMSIFTGDCTIYVKTTDTFEITSSVDGDKGGSGSYFYTVSSDGSGENTFASGYNFSNQSSITTTTFEATSFYTNEVSTGGGGGGDPYIVTLGGEFYKMSNFAGVSRMLQGVYDDKILTINAQTRFSTNNEKEYTLEYIENKIKQYELLNPSSTHKLKASDYIDVNNAYFTKTFIQWGNEYIIADMDKLEIIENKFSWEVIDEEKAPGIIEQTLVNLKQLDHYKCETERAIKIKIGDTPISIILSYSDNPQVRGSYCIWNGHLLKNTSGALVHKMYEKDIRVKNIMDVKPIQRLTNRLHPKKTTKEYYVNSKGNEQIKEIHIY